MVDDNPTYAVVAVALPVSKVYHYVVPPHLQGSLEVGHGVLVPFGARAVSGVVTALTDHAPIPRNRIKPIERVLTPTPVLSPENLRFLQWTADYYHHPLGEVIRTALPPGLLVQSNLTAALTPEGKAYLAGQSDLSDAMYHLLSCLDTHGSMRWTTLVDRANVPNPVGLARRAEEAGWLTLRHEVAQPRTRERYQKRYRPGPGTPSGRLRGRVQQAVLDLLIEMGETSQADLKKAMEARGLAVSSLGPVLRRLEDRGLIEATLQEVWRKGPEAFDVADQEVTLTTEQSEAMKALEEALANGTFAPFLLHGVTGSGKTELYLRAVEATLEAGRGALILVPEIALTPQLVGRFQARLGDRIACLHSGMSAGARFDAWRRLARGLVSVAIGARSAVFAPVPDLALIIVDEEHDASFKQEFGLRYNARDLAVVRAKLAHAVVVLGSATPSLETANNARQRRFKALHLTARVHDRPLPKVHIVDMTWPENRPPDETTDISPPLEEALRETIGAGDQAILLLNRRGFAPFVLCPHCGGSFRCTRCDISLTYHRRRNVLMCHYCGLAVRRPDRCPHCGHPDLSLLGYGTERLEQALEALFPGTPVARLDRDTTARPGAHLRILDAFRRGEFQILAGTQMVVKGHDFPGVTLVGILQADYALNLPDFRASERTFQLITQVAGRAGRGGRPGRVLVQTFAPNHPTVQLAAGHDVEGFYRREMRVRKAYSYPPFARLALFQISAKDERRAAEFASDVAEGLRKTCTALAPQRLLVLGPAPAALTRLKQWYRWQVLVKAATPRGLHAAVARFLAHHETLARASDVRLAVDVDPQSLL